MKINKIKINSYGKLKEKEIQLHDGINIVYGENESGKSTLLKFIVNSFYGISKNKKGKEYSDFDRYLPWTGEEFSGKIEYELNNKEKYEVYRDFKKKNPQIFNSSKEEISKQFNIDKTKGNEFFYEQTKMDEELFLSTVVVSQQEVRLGKQEQNMLVQKIANLVGTGDDNVSYKKAIDRINRRQLDEIGTDRSREKPINVLSRKIKELEGKKEELERYENLKYEIEENKNKLGQQITKQESIINILKELKQINENKILEEEKIKIKEQIKIENEEKIKNNLNKINQIKNSNKNILENKEKIKNNKINKKIFFIFILLIIINLLQFYLLKNKIFNYTFLLTIPLFLIIYYIYKINRNRKIHQKERKNKKELEKINLEINNLNNEINLIKENNENLEKEIIELKNNLNLKINLEKEKIKNKYLKYNEKNTINNIINTENINLKIEETQNELNNKKIELESLNLEQKNIEPKLENLSKIEEELVNSKNKMLTLEKLNESFELTKQVIIKSYDKMKNTVTPKFTRALSNNISRITDGKYTNIIFNDEQGIIIELDNGNYIPVDKLSIGTIDQLYLSLRLSMLEELSKEYMPIILDESFAYYDTKRLKNILEYISEKFKNHQVIILTCTNREKEILEELNISYNLNIL